MKQATGARSRRTRARPGDAKKPNKKAINTKKPKAPTKAKPPTRAKAVKRAKLQRKAKPVKPAKPAKAATPAKPEFDVRELDPVRKCGPDTSVEQLYRIDERTNGQVRTHLVFLDRHGWYCEHGRDCPAVAAARKAGIHARHTGPTNNGRTRA